VRETKNDEPRTLSARGARGALCGGWFACWFWQVWSAGRRRRGNRSLWQVCVGDPVLACAD
jgi:hypothetical protein